MKRKSIVFKKKLPAVVADDYYSATIFNCPRNMTTKKRLEHYKEAMGMDYYLLKEI